MEEGFVTNPFVVGKLQCQFCAGRYQTVTERRHHYNCRRRLPRVRLLLFRLAGNRILELFRHGIVNEIIQRRC